MMKDTIITKEVEEEVQDDNRNRLHQGGGKIFFPAGNRDHHRQNIQGQPRVQGHHQGTRPFVVVAHRLKGDLEELVLEAEVEVGEELKVRFQNVPKILLNIQQMIRKAQRRIILVSSQQVILLKLGLTTLQCHLVNHLPLHRPLLQLRQMILLHRQLMTMESKVELKKVTKFVC